MSLLTKYIALIILQEHPKVKKNAKFVNITSKILNNFASSWDSVFVDLVVSILDTLVNQVCSSYSSFV